MGSTHFLTKTLPKVAAEMALSVLAYNLTRVMNIVGIKPLMAAIRPKTERLLASHRLPRKGVFTRPRPKADNCRHANGRLRMLADASRDLIMSDFDEWKYRADRDATDLWRTAERSGGAKHAIVRAVGILEQQEPTALFLPRVHCIAWPTRSNISRTQRCTTMPGSLRAVMTITVDGIISLGRSTK